MHWLMRTRSCWFILAIQAAACAPGNIRPYSSTQDGSGIPAPVVAPTMLHRLNNLEYNNTVRDLLGTALRPADAFPADASSGGFDNMAPALSLSPALMTMLGQAAQDLADDALDPRPLQALHFLPAQFGAGGTPYSTGYSVGQPIVVNVNLTQNDTVTLSVTAGSLANQAATPIMGFTVDGQSVQSFTVNAPGNAPTAYTAQVSLATGTHAIQVSFDNSAGTNPFDGTGNGLFLYNIDVVSTQTVPAPNRSKVYACEPANANDTACWSRNVVGFATRAWRRPLTETESTQLTALWQAAAANGADDEAFKTVMRGVLMSSKFLFRTNDAQNANISTGVPLDDYALANRLSYFLWSSMPDDALRQAASSGALRTDVGLRNSVKRMLADPKASALREGFAAQWLSTRDLERATPDPNMFPAWNANIRTAMVAEAQGVFGDFLQNGRPLTDLFNPGFTYANDALATFYGLTAPGSATPVKVAVSDGSRGGLLTQGAFLVATSMANRTSPVKRGRWVLEQLLCKTLPPPPNVPPLPPVTQDANAPQKTGREQLAVHVASAGCAACHNIIDPLGFGLEEFDATGALRTQEAGRPVDASGAVNGVAFRDVYGMAAQLQSSAVLTSCLTQKMAAYALGRPLTQDDASTLAALATQMAAEGNTLNALITDIVLSPPFRLVNMEAP